MELPEVYTTLLAGQPLTEPQTEAVFERMLAGELDEAQIAALLALMQQRGVTVDELTGAARVMRRHVTRVPVPDDGVPVIDTCGTGGAPKTFNVSTAAAIVTAAAAPGRVRVAKHGNRSRTGRGSAEVLAQLGVNVDAPVEVQARCLERVGVCFCFAIHHHPATRFAIGPRRSLGFPTIFNLLGPLTNPAGATRQLIGIYDKAMVEPMGLVLARLGSEHAMVVHSADGLDEIAVSDRTRVATVRDGRVTMDWIEPRTLGIERAALDDLRASTLDEAESFIRQVLAGETGPRRDFVLINTAGALLVAGIAESLGDGFDLAARAIDDGAAQRTLDDLARCSHEGA